MELWQEIVSKATNGIVVVGTMDAWVKWRAGEVGGYMGELLRKIDIALFCMEEYESYDVQQVYAGMGNLAVKTLLMAGDKHQRIEPCHSRGLRAIFDQTPNQSYDLGEDGEEYSTKAMGIAKFKKRYRNTTTIVPEYRPWYEWCKNNVQNAILDHCKRCGPDVCKYVNKCFDFADTFESDKCLAL